MSRYPPPDYRGSRDRSRSPPRFADRRPSAASIFDSRAPGPPRNASDAPRGPRSQQFDAQRPPFAGGGPGPAPGPGPGVGTRPGYASLRDAPPLGSSERGRPFREREYDRRDRVPSPRERSPPPRNFKDPRDFPPRDLDISRARRGSRDGPPSAGSNLSENPPFAAAPFRGAFGRGRGRGDLGSFRGNRGGRRDFDEREVFRRERSPPPPQRWSRDLSREGREPERRDERRPPFERREDDRRPEWVDREREVERPRRDQPPPRHEARPPNDLTAGGPQTPSAPQAPPAPQIDPGRLALLEQAGADVSIRRPSASQNAPPPRDARRDLPETPSYLNGRAETMANRYNQRGSSPPTQAAPAVPAFGTLSFAPPAPQAHGVSNAQNLHAPKVPHEGRSASLSVQKLPTEPPTISVNDRAEPPADAPTALKAPPPAPKAEFTEVPPSAPKAQREVDVEAADAFGARLHGVRSLENVNVQGPPTGAYGAQRANSFTRPFPAGPTPLPSAQPAPTLPTLIQPVSPNTQTTRFGEFAAPTGPRATRMSPAQASVSPRPPFASPRSDVGLISGFAGFPRGQTPPSAPSGPRNRSYSVSPKVTSSTVPTAPKGSRAPPIAPRAAERGMPVPGRVPDRLAAPPPWAPPSAPRGSQWHQWRRPSVPAYSEKTIPAKRDFAGEKKEQQAETASRRNTPQPDTRLAESTVAVKTAEEQARLTDLGSADYQDQGGDRMDVDPPDGEPAKQSQASGHSAAQSFFGKPVESTEDAPGISDAPDEPVSSSDDDEADLEEDLALSNAKYERQKRVLESQLADLSAREYRATTPLESIARLARMSPKDLQRVQEHQAMEVDEGPEPAVVDNNLLVPPATHSSGSDEGPDLLTPKGEEDTAVEVRSGDENSDTVRRARRPSPEVINLPYLVKDAQPFEESDDFQSNVRRQQETKAAVLAALQQEAEEEAAADEDSDEHFRDFFRDWRGQCEDLDREREEVEKLERQQSAEPGLEVDAPTIPPVNPGMEGGRRLHKFSSEYEIEQVIKQSEETARLEQERQDRESRKLQADMEKEAKIPDQQRETAFKRGVFIDTNRLRDPDKLTLAFSYEPQPDTFTEDEQRLFIAAFKETPKKWGEIASLLPNRSYKDCIHHYYANKWDGRFRDNRTRKLKAGGRRGRGGKAPPRGRGPAMADMGRTEEIVPPSVSESGRPKRAAAPTTFGEREADAKATLLGPSPAKKPGLGPRQDTNGDAGPEKPGKRRKGAGEKPGRKPKAQQPLAALAAAPAVSPKHQFLPSIHNKEEVPRAPSLEDANLLAGLQSGHHGMLTGDGQLIYHQQEGFGPPMLRDEELARSKALGQSSVSKSSASSYWSVPEQTDFAKYIAHFGTDFAAIAAHMGTKTQTMIKNHYQRQIDSGNRPELQTHAIEADRRREAGEDMGAPPTPTPIVKRKYDNPQPTAPRTLAPNTEAMEIEEALPPQRAPQPPKHVSPPQFQAQPRFTSSAQATPIPSHRVIQSPVPSTASPAMSQAQPAAPARPLQHPLGQRLAFFQDTRPESRPGLPATSSFRLGQETPPRSQPQQSNVPDNYISNLVQEQQRALRMQAEQSQQDRVDQLHRPSSLSSIHRGSAHGSPASQPLQAPLERKPPVEERAPTPPRSTFVQSPFSRPLFTQPMFGPLSSTPGTSSLMGRAAFNVSPQKKEEPRPSSVPAVPPAPTTVTPAPPPEPPKRSNLMSILNADADEPKPPKRESLAAAPQRAVSPALSTFSNAPTPGAPPGTSQQRRETFGQTSMPQSQFHRPSFGPQSQTPAPPPPQAVKREPSGGGAPLAHPRKPDWASQVLSKPSQPSQANQPTLERDTRPYFSHRAAALGALNQPTRGNPSPPPHNMIGHSRTPSLTMQPSQPPAREQHPALQGQQPQHGQRGPVQPLHSNPYAQQPAGTPFSQPPPQQVQNHAHHAHNGSLGAGFPGMHHRAPSREDVLRRQQQDEQAFAAATARERDEQEWRRMQDRELRERLTERDPRELERQRAEQFYVQQRQHREEQERHQQQFPRGPPQRHQQPPVFSGPAFPQPNGNNGLRDQAKREMEAALRDQDLRHQDEQQRRAHQEDMMRYEAHRQREQEMEAIWRRQQQQQQQQQLEDPMFQRRTPLGNGFGHPPPQPPRR
ncbi:hypothetical protein LTR85_007019 [Meristemomyces frigidus]|nr:hypothetical protein LTR85_007019 [Meristemomyces frigidus]